MRQACAHRLLLDEVGDKIGDGGHLAGLGPEKHAQGMLLVVGVAPRPLVLLDLQQAVCLRQQLGGEQQQNEVGFPDQLIGQDAPPLLILTAGWVVLHQSHRV